MSTTLRRLEADEWELLRSLRLAALRDAPDAFGPTLEAALAEPEATWRRQARRLARSEDAALLVAERDGSAVGIVSATRRGPRGFIGAMWVAPATRRAGVARQLLEAACRRLEEQGCQRIALSVTETNTTAIGFYRSFGFELTGESHPLREGSPLRELQMERAAAVAPGGS